MNDEIVLFTDKIEDLEDSLLQLQSEIGGQKKANKPNKKSQVVATPFVVLLPLFLIISIGLNINYQSDKHQISYSNDSLIELCLGGLTLFSSFYSFKKYQDKDES